MNLRDLLAETRGNILRDVSTAVDGRVADGALWSDDALIRYLRDAEEKFASGAMCLRDSRTPAIAQITLVAGVSEYPLDKRVIAILSAHLDGRLELGRTSYATRFGAKGNITQNTASETPQTIGEPRIFYTDKDTGYIGFYPVPGDAEAGLVINLHTVRRPLNPLTKNDMAAEPEIPDEYHLDLCEWATWRALRNHDGDIDGDPNNISIVMARSNAHKKRFEDAIKECKQKSKYMHTQHVEFGVRANWS